MSAIAAAAASSIDLVITRYREPLDWLEPYFGRPGWRIFVYNTGKRPPPRHICARAATCTQVPNAGFEWHGYLRHVADRYDRLADLTLFMQGDPFTVSPDVHCLLNQTQAFAPVQVLSWVQQAKRKMELFSTCRASFLGGCRVWIEPVTAGLKPMLHGDRWLHRACRMAKRFKGSLWQFLYSQLGSDDPAEATGPAAVHRALIERQTVPARLYRAYGAQFGAARHVLRELLLGGGAADLFGLWRGAADDGDAGLVLQLARQIRHRAQGRRPPHALASGGAAQNAERAWWQRNLRDPATLGVQAVLDAYPSLLKIVAAELDERAIGSQS